jgi:hypothetical protein
MAGKKTTYEDLIKHNPKIADVLDPDVFKFVQKSNEKTIAALGETWERNTRRNLKKYFKKYGLLVDNCRGFGFDKATVMIGAGPSLKRNWEVLKKINAWNFRYEFKHQPFLFIASNHQFKPCLEAGITPHFVILVDASDSESIYNQLCVDIPKIAKPVVLFCAMHVNPKIVKDWTAQGRQVQFYIPNDDENKELVKRIIGKDLSSRSIVQGGNVSNVAFVASLVAFDSRVFITLGNDLSYDIHGSIKERRKSYYADGDYSTNLASGRDEAKGAKNWCGFTMRRNPFQEGKSILDLPVIKGTTDSLFTYKQWIETYIAIQDVSPSSFHYYNCSEEGILGVMPKSFKKIDMDDSKSWQLLDDVFPNRYHTRMFEDVISDIIILKEMSCQTRRGIANDVNNTVIWHPKMDSARIADLKSTWM